MMYFLQEFNIIFIIITKGSWQVTRMANLKISDKVWPYLFVIYLTALSKADYIDSNARIINDWMWEEVVMA